MVRLTKENPYRVDWCADKGYPPGFGAQTIVFQIVFYFGGGVICTPQRDVWPLCVCVLKVRGAFLRHLLGIIGDIALWKPFERHVNSIYKQIQKQSRHRRFPLLCTETDGWCSNLYYLIGVSGMFYRYESQLVSPIHFYPFLFYILRDVKFWP